MRLFWLLLTVGCAHAACPPSGTRLLVDATTHELSLCEEGRAARRYRVALGRGGLDKQKEGDARTPLGEYPLAPGRPSAEFHTFLAVGYPTVEQRREGLTGGAVGVHGPGRSFRLLGALSTSYDWTAGCIAVDSDAAIDEIAAWVRARHASVIAITRTTK